MRENKQQNQQNQTKSNKTQTKANSINMSEQTGVEMGKLSGPEEQNKRDHIQNSKKQQRTTKNNKKQQKTTKNNKRQQQQVKTATTTWTQPKQTSINHNRNQNHTATTQNTPKQQHLPALAEKKGTFSDLAKQQEELWRCRFHPQGRCLAPRQLPNFGGCTPIKTLHLPETDPFSGLLLVGPFTAVIDLEKK